MKKLLLGVVVTIGLIAPLQAAQACRGNFLGSYSTFITPRDTVASDGVRIGNVLGIIQQDRANLHHFRRGDRGDGYDDMFLRSIPRADPALAARGRARHRRSDPPRPRGHQRARLRRLHRGQARLPRVRYFGLVCLHITSP